MLAVASGLASVTLLTPTPLADETIPAAPEGATFLPVTAGDCLSINEGAAGGDVGDKGESSGKRRCRAALLGMGARLVSTVRNAMEAPGAAAWSGGGAPRSLLLRRRLSTVLSDKGGKVLSDGAALPVVASVVLTFLKTNLMMRTWGSSGTGGLWS